MELLQSMDGVFIEKCFRDNNRCINNANMFKIYGADN